MYKSSSQKLSHIGRSGSASTRGAANGGLVAPRDAEQAEAYFNSIRERFDRISSLAAETRQRIAEIHRRLGLRPPPAEAAKLRQELKERTEMRPDLELEHARYGMLAKVAALNAFGATFYEIARRKIDPVLFKAMTYETEMMLNRAPDAGIFVPPIPKPNATTQPKSRRQNGRRVSAREVEVVRAGRIRAGGGTLVWSDERDRHTEHLPEVRR